MAQIEEGLDFSKSMKPKPASTPKQTLSYQNSTTKRFNIYLLGVLVFVLILLILSLVYWNQKPTAVIPEGYHLVTPKDQPAYITPNK